MRELSREWWPSQSSRHAKGTTSGVQARNSTDNLIIATALDVREAGSHRAVIFVSKDVNLRIRAKALGLSVADYDADKQEAKCILALARLW